MLYLFKFQLLNAMEEYYTDYMDRTSQCLDTILNYQICQILQVPVHPISILCIEIEYNIIIRVSIHRRVFQSNCVPCAFTY